MKIKTIIIGAVWFILFMILLDVGLKMVSAANTIENLAGFFIILATVLVSYKTQCLTTISINFKRKHEE